MKPTLTALAVAAALVVAACGGGSDSGNAQAGAAATTVSIASIDGNDVLVDSKGAALYASDQEKDGTVRCTGGCASVWLPLTAPGSGQPTAAGDVAGKLGVVKRPDGKRQVTLAGRPLYRFAQDGGSGKVSGDGASDSFGGRQFTWHVEGTGGTSSGGGKGSSYSY
jgi:predicted lipoprotein with Yx(FWY)xxD motif